MMVSLLAALATLAAAQAAPPAAPAPAGSPAGAAIVLKPALKPLSRDMDATPRLPGGGPAVDKVNAALAKIDERAQTAAHDCENQNADRWGWQHEVSAPIQYGRYLSMAVTDTWACALGSGSTSYGMTFDLTTGDQVDWLNTIAQQFVGGQITATAGDGGSVTAYTSPLIDRIYRNRVVIARDVDTRDTCAALLDRQTPVMFWLDAERQGLVMRGAGLPANVAPCADETVLTLDDMKKLAAPQEMIDAVTAAHAAHAWTQRFRKTTK